MEAFEPRSIINAGMAKQKLGSTISIMLRIDSISGTVFTGISTDKQKVRVNLLEPLDARKGDWVEVIGVPVNSETIRAKEVILFCAENIVFDEEGYNMMVQFMNNCKEIFRSG